MYRELETLGEALCIGLSEDALWGIRETELGRGCDCRIGELPIPGIFIEGIYAQSEAVLHLTCARWNCSSRSHASRTAKCKQTRHSGGASPGSARHRFLSARGGLSPTVDDIACYHKCALESAHRSAKNASSLFGVGSDEINGAM